MAREFARQFYHSKEWEETRAYILRRDNYLCRMCGSVAEEVHHIEHLTPENIGDTSITMNPDNLISLCRDCHCKQHHKDRVKNRLPEQVFDENGYLVSIGE